MKILFPTDFSQAAENAFGYANAFAKDIDATLDVVHIYHLPFVDAANVPPEFIEQMLEEKRGLAAEKLERFLQKQPGAKIGERLLVYGVFVPVEIKDLVKEKKYDLIIMGTRGEKHSKVEKALGSITTHTMMQAGCPVLAVPENAEWKEVKRIAFATDFDKKDNLAVDQLMSFAGKIAAEVHFVHVETRPGIGHMEDFITLANYPYKFTDFAVINSPTVLEGVDKYISKKDIDLLALFIPKRRLWERLFHSSFTKQMAFHSKTPLLVFQE
jgi:nucleotide-binding universal stress UspA family protein